MFDVGSPYTVPQRDWEHAHFQNENLEEPRSDIDTARRHSLIFLSVHESTESWNREDLATQTFEND